MSAASVERVFHVVDVGDDEAAVKVRAQLARAAAVAGISEANLHIMGRPQARHDYLTVHYWSTPEQQTAFHAALTAEGLKPVKRVEDRWVDVEG